MQVVALLTVAVLGGLLAVVVLRAVGRRGCGRALLKPHYLRLGQVAPGEPCPCERGRAANRAYQDCCRRRDIEKLMEDIRDYLWRRWSRTSWAGRRWSRSMNYRLEDYPLPKPVLPRWVTAPGEFTFPIDQSVLRGWSPWPQRGLGGTGIRIRGRRI